MRRVLLNLTICFCIILVVSSCSQNPTALQNSNSSTLAFGSSYGHTYVFRDAGVYFHQVKYISSENAGASPLNATRNWIGMWEQYSLVKNSDGSVSLRSFAQYGGNNDFRFVIVSNNGTGPLIANATNNSSPYSRFILEQYTFAQGWYYVKCQGNGKYLETEPTNNNLVQIFADNPSKNVVYGIYPTYPNAIPPSSAQSTNNSTSWEWPGLIFLEQQPMEFITYAHNIPAGTTCTFSIDGTQVSKSFLPPKQAFIFYSLAVSYSHDVKVTFSQSVTLDSISYNYSTNNF